VRGVAGPYAPGPGSSAGARVGSGHPAAFVSFADAGAAARARAGAHGRVAPFFGKKLFCALAVPRDAVRRADARTVRKLLSTMPPAKYRDASVWG